MIFVADLHIRHDVPVARKDDYLEAQDKKLDYLFDLSKRLKDEIIVAGDFFDVAKPPHWLITYVMDKIISHKVKGMTVVPGQHDLPSHNIHLLNDSGLGILEQAGLIRVVRNPTFLVAQHGLNIWACPFGMRPINLRGLDNPLKGVQVLVWHQLINFKKRGSTTITGSRILSKFGYDVLVTGDNHKKFYYRTKTGKKVVNPGSMMRMDANQITHKPTIFHITKEFHEMKETDKMPVVVLYNYPIKDGVLDRTHIEQKKKKDKRIAYFVSKLRKGFEVKNSFKKNLVLYLKENKISKLVKQTILEHMEE